MCTKVRLMEKCNEHSVSFQQDVRSEKPKDSAETGPFRALYGLVSD